MLLIPEKKAVLVRPKNPKRLLKLIPTAECVNYKGKRVVAVPHRLDETRVLNNLGMRVPSPMLRTYEWPRAASIKNPFEAQRETAGFLSLHSRAFVLNDLGTGKTLAALWAYDYLRAKGLAEKLLVICPLSTLERAWADELFFHFRHLTYRVLYGTAAKRKKELAADADVYIVNHHGAQIVQKELSTRQDITHVVVDELAQSARNKRTGMWKAFNHIINGPIKRAAWGMTATPIPNEPTDAYAQVKLIRPERATMYFTAFRNLVMNQVNQFMWVPRPDAVDRVDEIMQPSIRFHRSQCVDLPPTIYMDREALLTKEQTKAYNDMHKELVAQLESGEILAVNEAVKVSKLVQIACGVVYNSEGEEAVLGADNRVKLTLELIEQSDSKTIVFVPFRSALNMVAGELMQAGHKVGIIHGGVSKNARDEIFQGFQHGGNPGVIVAQPAAMSHGLTLTSASTIIWYAPVTSAETYEQANGRITRPGQKHTTVIAHIEGTPVERRIYHKLRTKQAMQNLLLERKVFHEAA